MNLIMLTLLLIVAVLAGLFVFRSKLIQVTDLVLKFAFILSIALALLAILWPLPFITFADLALSQAGTKQAVQDIEQRAQQLDPGNLINNIEDFFQLDQQQGNTDSETANALSENTTSDDLYAQIVAAVADVLRMFTLLFAFSALLIILYLSYATDSAVKVIVLEERLKALEQRIGSTGYKQN